MAAFLLAMGIRLILTITLLKGHVVVLSILDEPHRSWPSSMISLWLCTNLLISFINRVIQPLKLVVFLSALNFRLVGHILYALPSKS